MISDDDGATLADLATLCNQMSAEELQRFCEGTIKAASLGVAIFRARFPKECAQFERGTRPRAQES